MYLQFRSQHHSPVLARFHPPKADPTPSLPSPTLPSSTHHHLASVSTLSERFMSIRSVLFCDQPLLPGLMVSGLPHVVQGSSLHSFFMAELYSIIRIYIVVCLFVHLLVDVWFISAFWFL